MKKVYSPPRATKLVEDEAKQFVTDRTNCSDDEAEDVLQSLRKERLDHIEKEETQEDQKIQERKAS